MINEFSEIDFLKKFSFILELSDGFYSKRILLPNAGDERDYCVQFLSQEDPQELVFLARKIPGTEEPGGLGAQQRVGHKC